MTIVLDLISRGLMTIFLDLISRTRYLIYAGASIFLALGGCVTSNVTPTADVAPVDAMDSVRNTDMSPRYPLANEGSSGSTSQSTQPFLFPGSDVAPDPKRDPDPDIP